GEDIVKEQRTKKLQTQRNVCRIGVGTGVAHCLQPSRNKHASSSPNNAGGRLVFFRQTSAQIYDFEGHSPYTHVLYSVPLIFVTHSSRSSANIQQSRRMCKRRVPELNADRSKCEKQKRTPFSTKTQHTTPETL
ncbi:unnamed protein product, partial [Ectocarpus sp. 12 AP-2014]